MVVGRCRSALGAGPRPPSDDPEPRASGSRTRRSSSPAGWSSATGWSVTVNDSGDEARVFTVDRRPADRRGDPLGGRPGRHRGAGAGRPTARCWVGDIGDNAAGRGTVSVTRVPVGPGRPVEARRRVRARLPRRRRGRRGAARPPRDRPVYVVTKGVFGGDVLRRARGRSRRRRQPAAAASAAPCRRHRRRVLPRRAARGAARLHARRRLRLPLAGRGRRGRRCPPQQQGEGIAVDDDGRVCVSTEGLQAPVARGAAGRPLPTTGAHGESAATPASRRSLRPSRRRSRAGAGRTLPDDEDAGSRDPAAVAWAVGGLRWSRCVVLVRSLRRAEPR